MNPLALIALAPIVLAAPAAAQPMDNAQMPGMTMPAPAAKKPAVHKAKPAPNPAAADPHAGHVMPASPEATLADPHAGHAMPPGSPPMGQSAMPGMAMPGASGGSPLLSQVEVPKRPPPAAPTDHAADRYFSPEAMAAARTQLRNEHGAMPVSKVMANLAEYQARKGADGYRWEGQAWFGGDIDRFVLKTEGEGTRGDGVESAELQALYSRAVGVYTDVQAGVRQDFEPKGRTYATVGFETLLPYWFEVEGAAFLSTKGELLARLEGSYDLRLTNQLILQPRAELNFAAQDTRATRTGSGLSNAELGLRLRYEIRREFAPYIGVSWDRKFGNTGDYARALGEDPTAKSVVVGVRAWF